MEAYICSTVAPAAGLVTGTHHTQVAVAAAVVAAAVVGVVAAASVALRQNYQKNERGCHELVTIR